MADKTIDDRLQPSLLDRLTDEEPDSRTESRDTRVIDIRRLREILKRDLAWLLNTNNQEAVIDREKYPNAFRSVVNYGVSPVAGGSSSSRKAQLIRAAIVQAVREFEPRIRPESLEVKLRDQESASQMSVFFDIHGDMWAQPLPLELFLRSEVDLMTGHVNLEQRS